MDWMGDRGCILESVKKYRWAMLILAVGILLMLLPEPETKDRITETVSQETRQQETLQQQLEEILTQLEGAGKVRVLLTEATGQQTVYQTDQDRRKSQDSQELRSETVLYSGGSREETGLVQRIDPPKYMGAIVLCQGAGSAAVRLAIVDAVATATGLGSDRISVWKMK